MNPAPLQKIDKKKLLAAVCLLIFCGMAFAAFWPFNPFPANHAAWLGDENGLRFGGGGIILSSGKFELTESGMPSGASLVIWLEPSPHTDSTILVSFSSPVYMLRIYLTYA